MRLLRRRPAIDPESTRTEVQGHINEIRRQHGAIYAYLGASDEFVVLLPDDGPERILAEASVAHIEGCGGWTVTRSKDGDAVTITPQKRRTR